MIAPTKRVLAIILAGGKGERLYPLTHERSKPAVPFGGKYRIIDFVLSNFVNSGIHSIYVLVQYMSQSLIEYLRSSWRTVGLTRDQFITVVPPQMRLGTMWYRGTADEVRQNLNLIRDLDPDIVAVFGDRPWISGLTFFLPSILFDLLDGNFAGTLSHLVAYILIRRLKLLLNFNRIPACIFWGLILAFLDRAVYGTLVGLKAGAGTGWVLRSIIDPAYFLTVLF